MKLRDLNWGLIWSLVFCIGGWLVIILAFVGALCGCSQRQVKHYEYTLICHIHDGVITKTKETHREQEYKSNMLASGQSVDWLFLDLPDKGRLMFGPLDTKNDHFDLWTPWGKLGTKGDE